MSVMTLTHSVLLSDGSVLAAGTQYTLVESLRSQDEETGIESLGFTALLVETGQRVFLTELDLNPEWLRKMRPEMPAFLARVNRIFARLSGQEPKAERGEMEAYLDEEGVAPATEPLSRVRSR